MKVTSVSAVSIAYRLLREVRGYEKPTLLKPRVHLGIEGVLSESGREYLIGYLLRVSAEER